LDSSSSVTGPGGDPRLRQARASKPKDFPAFSHRDLAIHPRLLAPEASGREPDLSCRLEPRFPGVTLDPLAAVRCWQNTSMNSVSVSVPAGSATRVSSTGRTVVHSPATSLILVGTIVNVSSSARTVKAVPARPKDA
jgi:hypothetical protein